MNRPIILLSALAVLASHTALAGDELCRDANKIGNFDIAFEGANFDGEATEFTYCFTGLANPALSNFMVALDPLCIRSEDIRQCQSGTCFHQNNDPNLGLTGIKFEDIEVEQGDTQCFSFSLDGDWSNTLQDVSLGLKAGPSTDVGAICGPGCTGPCAASLQVDTQSEPTVLLDLIHRRVPTYTGGVTYKLVDQNGNQVIRWVGDAFSVAFGERYQAETPIPNGHALEPGRYLLQMRLNGMSGWRTLRTSFVID